MLRRGFELGMQIRQEPEPGLQRVQQQFVCWASQLVPLDLALEERLTLQQLLKIAMAIDAPWPIVGEHDIHGGVAVDRRRGG